MNILEAYIINNFGYFGKPEYHPVNQTANSKAFE